MSDIEIGSKVVFRGASEAQVNWGGNNDPNKVCELGAEYEIESVDVHSWHTKVELVGIEGTFNSVSFEASDE